MIAEFDPIWALYLKDNPFALVALTLVAVIVVIRHLIKHDQPELVTWPLGVALVIAIFTVGLCAYVILTKQQVTVTATTAQPRSPSATASTKAVPPAPKNVQIVQGNNNTVISE